MDGEHTNGIKHGTTVISEVMEYGHTERGYDKDGKPVILNVIRHGNWGDYKKLDGVVRPLDGVY